MKKSQKSFAISFKTFDIKCDVHLEESVELTSRFGFDNPDFVYAAAEKWLMAPQGAHLLVAHERPPNLLEEIAYLEKCVMASSIVPGLESIIERGTWCAWMHGYWQRVDCDTVTPKDEVTYDLLIQLAVWESRDGHMAIYLYNGSRVVEVATRPEIGPPVHVWEEFEPSGLHAQLAVLRTEISKAVLHAATTE